MIHLVKCMWKIQIYHVNSCVTAKHVQKIIKYIQQGWQTWAPTSETMLRVIQMALSNQENNYLFYNNPLKYFNNGRSEWLAFSFLVMFWDLI